MLERSKQIPKRQREAVYWLSEGYSVTDIAYEMDVDFTVIYTLLKGAQYQLDARNLDELIVKAIMRGWIKKQFGYNRGSDD